MLSENANFRINNVNNAISLLIRVRIELHTSICFLVKILENVHIFVKFFLYNSDVCFRKY